MATIPFIKTPSKKKTSAKYVKEFKTSADVLKLIDEKNPGGFQKSQFDSDIKKASSFLNRMKKAAAEDAAGSTEELP